MDDYGEDGWEEEPPRSPQLAPHVEEKDDELVLQDCLEPFKSKDYIMEPEIFTSIKRFFQAGGETESLVDLLADNYIGTAQSANLLANWLIVTGADVHDVEQIVEDHLKTLVVQNFDVKKADSIFTEEGGTPSWLEQMIQHQTWRSMIYKLAEQYPDCLMLNFTIKLISDVGYQDEIARVTSACHQIEVFSRVLKTSIHSFLDDGDEFMQKRLEEFTKMVSHGHHTFLYTQCLLHLLSQSTEGGTGPRRLGQEICLGAQKVGHDVVQILLALNGSSKYPRASSALSSILTRNALNPGDITVLYKLYSSQDPPPVELVRLSQFMDLLLNSLFKPGYTPHSDHKHKYVYLLAYAASVHEIWGESSRESLNKDDLKSTRQAIERVHTVCSREIGVASQASSEISMLYQCARFPAVAMGILKWVDYTLSEPSFFKLMTDSTPLHLALLDEISTCHPLQHSQVLSLLIRIFESPTHLDTLVELGFKKTILDRMVHLVSRGYVVAVVSYIRKCTDTQKVDNSLIRHFVTEVLDIIAPPYSDEFVDLFLPVVQNEEITGSLRNAEKNDDVSIFIAHCGEHHS